MPTHSQNKKTHYSSAKSLLGVKELIDNYGERRRSVHRSALMVLLVSLTLAAVSRSPKIVINLENLTEIAKPEGVLVNGVMPIFGPPVVYFLYLHMYLGILEAVSLRRQIIPRLRDKDAEAERELLNPPLLSVARDESGRIGRIANDFYLGLWCCGPIICYGFLFYDFCFELDFDGKVISRGYELFYALRGWTGIWPSGHFGSQRSLPPVYPIWQPILYTMLFLHLLLLAYDAVRQIIGQPRKGSRGKWST